MKRKSQIAMESLMVYGIAILIVMLAIGALIYFGVLDLGSYLPDKCSLPGSVKCENFRASTADIQLELRNTVGKNIRITRVTWNGTDDWNTYGCDSGALTQTINNGDLQAFTISTDMTGRNCDGLPISKKIKGILLVEYNVVGSSITVPLQGELQAKVG